MPPRQYLPRWLRIREDTDALCENRTRRSSAIVEESQLTGEQREINEINSAIYCFTLEKLWPALAQVKPNNKHRELYLTDAVALLAAKAKRVLAQVARDSREVLGCNTRADLAEVDRIFREWKRAEMMESGVTIQLPETVLIDPDVVAGEDTVIEPGVQLLGKTKIGERCTIRAGSVLSDAILGDEVIVEAHSMVAQSRIDDRVIVGPFARLRAGQSCESRMRALGNFVELKKSIVGEGTKAMHLTYLGDAKIGAQNKHWRRHHHLQLRRLPQTPDKHWQQSFYRQRFGSGRASARGRWRLRRGGFRHHRQCSRGWFGNCPRPASEQSGMGFEETPRTGRCKSRKKRTAKKKSARKAHRKNAAELFSTEIDRSDKFLCAVPSRAVLK